MLNASNILVLEVPQQSKPSTPPRPTKKIQFPWQATIAFGADDLHPKRANISLRGNYNLATAVTMAVGMLSTMARQDASLKAKPVYGFFQFQHPTKNLTERFQLKPGLTFENLAQAANLDHCFIRKEIDVTKTEFTNKIVD